MTETIGRILVPVDFSAHSDRALRYAAGLAAPFAAQVELLHVVEDPYLTGAWSSDVYVPKVPELMADLRADAERRLAALKSATAGVTVETGVMTGRTAQTIVDRARDGGFDLIVMATHGRTGVAHLVLGSVAERVVRTAACPVLTVRDAPARQGSDG